jgi:acyl transferase domain-containing protein
MGQDMTSQGVMSPSGLCKTFDASADGYARAEGINVVMVKLLKDAIRDQDPVRAVIRSTAVNSDGGSSNLSVPSPTAQKALIKRAYEVAGIPDLSQTAFVECHGTGTRVGDPIEAGAIGESFGKRGVYIGSASTIS